MYCTYYTTYVKQLYGRSGFSFAVPNFIESVEYPCRLDLSSCYFADEGSAIQINKSCCVNVFNKECIAGCSSHNIACSYIAVLILHLSLNIGIVVFEPKSWGWQW